MSSINQLKKGIATSKEDILSKYSKDGLMRKIKALCDTYYISYINDNESDFHAAAGMLDTISAIAKDEYPNVDDFINYCMIVAINRLLNSLMDRKMDLMIPEAVEIDTTSEVVVNLLERVKQKRKELKDLKDKGGC